MQLEAAADEQQTCIHTATGNALLCRRQALTNRVDWNNAWRQAVSACQWQACGVVGQIAGDHNTADINGTHKILKVRCRATVTIGGEVH
jgi:hypothetical protein